MLESPRGLLVWERARHNRIMRPAGHHSPGEGENPSGYGIQTNGFNSVTFKPVSTTALRIEATLQPGKSGGVLEWTVE